MLYIRRINKDQVGVANTDDGVIEWYSKADVLQMSKVVKIHGVDDEEVKIFNIVEYLNKSLSKYRIAGVLSGVKVEKARTHYISLVPASVNEEFKGSRVVIPDGIECLGTMWLIRGENVTIRLPKSLKKIGERCFDYVDFNPDVSLKIPDGVFSIDDKAFIGSHITSITLPYSLRSLGEEVFLDCNWLREVKFTGYQLSKVSKSCFQNCITLNKVVFSKGIETIGKNAFYATGLVDLVLPSTVIRLESTCFMNSAIENLKVLGIVSLGNEVFKNCKALKFADLSHCRSMGKATFMNCIALTGVDISSELLVNLNKDTFNNCVSLTYVKFSRNLESIGESCFRDCHSLRTINLPDSIVCIGVSAFEDCTALSGVVLPSGLKHLGSGVFSGCCNLKTLNMRNVERMCSDALDGCDKLEEIIVKDINTVKSVDLSQHLSSIKRYRTETGVFGRDYEYVVC